MVKFIFGKFKVVTTNKKIKKENAIIQSNIRGIVIEENGTIKVKIDDNIYDITEDSYDCKGKKEVWYKNIRDKHGKYICIIRAIDDRKAMDERFIPFRVGLPCTGDLIKESFNKPKFRIKKCINPIYERNQIY